MLQHKFWLRFLAVSISEGLEKILISFQKSGMKLLGWGKE